MTGDDLPALTEIVAAESGRAGFPAAGEFAAALRDHYGPTTAGVVFYGSSLRQQTDLELMLDFYVLVDTYRGALQSLAAAATARLLPPNVYYHEYTFEGRTLRAKVAVMAVDQFLRGVAPETFTASLWARFAQPAAILYARDNEIRRDIIEGLANAVHTMILRTLPLMNASFTAHELWVRAFRETYGAELRPEQDAKGAELVDAGLARYSAVTTAVLGVADSNGLYRHAPAPAARRAAERAWRLRRVLGKALNVLRLIKAAFTFQGGLDYAAWKIERHSGVKIELSEADRKRPLLTGARLLFRTLRRGGLR